MGSSLLKVVILFLVIFAATGDLSASTDLFDDARNAEHALQIGDRLSFGSSSETFLIDGQVKSKTTGSLVFDRTLSQRVEAHGQFPLHPQITLRLRLPVEYSFQKVEGAEAPRTIEESSRYEMTPTIELNYRSAQALEFLVGLRGIILPAYTKIQDSDGMRAEARYDSFKTWAPAFGVVKRNAGLEAGLLYFPVIDAERKLKKSVESIDLRVDDVDRVYLPSSISLFGRQSVGSGRVLAQMTLVEASGGGPRSSTGSTLLEDYFRIHLAWSQPLGGKDLELETGLFHRTFSYADRQVVDFDTIPLTAIEGKVYWSAILPLHLGLCVVRGHDTQSLAEFNSDLKIWGLGGEFGVHTVF